MPFASYKHVYIWASVVGCPGITQNQCDGRVCGNLSGKQAHTQLVRDIRPQLSQLTEPLWTDPGLKSGIGVRRKLFSTSENKK